MLLILPDQWIQKPKALHISTQLGANKAHGSKQLTGQNYMHIGCSIIKVIYYVRHVYSCLSRVPPSAHTRLVVLSCFKTPTNQQLPLGSWCVEWHTKLTTETPSKRSHSLFN